MDDLIPISPVHNPYDISDKKNLDRLMSEVGDGKIVSEISHLIQARYKVLYITSNEERRVLETLKMIAVKYSYGLKTWDLSAGLFDIETATKIEDPEIPDLHFSPNGLVQWCIKQANEFNSKARLKNVSKKSQIIIAYDLYRYLNGDQFLLERKIKEFSSITSNFCLIIVAPVFKCSVDLSNEISLLDFPYPSKQEIKKAIHVVLKGLEDKLPEATKFLKKNEELLLNSSSGLTLTECENSFSKSLVKTKTFNIPIILEEKKQLIKKNGLLEFIEPRFKLDDIGGLDTLKNWIKVRKSAFSKEAQDYGIQTPKGVMILGIPGTGKSMACETIADYYDIPLLRLDVGSVFGSFVGQSESNIRNIIKICEAVSPVCLWIDEVEKGLGGVNSSNHTDGGTTSRVFGTLLTWMQDKTKPAFVVCTGNKVTDIPPEFMRAGRFDEIFFVDLPEFDQRVEVLECLLLRKQRNPDHFDLKTIASKCENYSPAEIEKAISNALFVAFSENKRKLVTNDIVSEIGKFQPLWMSRKEDILAMREWAKNRAVRANSNVSAKVSQQPTWSITEETRDLDVELEL